MVVQLSVVLLSFEFVLDLDVVALGLLKLFDELLVVEEVAGRFEEHLKNHVFCVFLSLFVLEELDYVLLSDLISVRLFLFDGDV